MAVNVRIIPAIAQQAAAQNLVAVKRRTAAYARVSTDSEEQLTSYEAQVDYYTKYIKERPDWEFIKVYTDEGISATSTKKRDGFNLMIADALKGQIDLIITKSVSRFARNTVDSLVTVRRLKEKGVEVYLKKKISTRWTAKATFNYHYVLPSSGRKPLYFGKRDLGTAQAHGRR